MGSSWPCLELTYEDLKREAHAITPTQAWVGLELTYEDLKHGIRGLGPQDFKFGAYLRGFETRHWTPEFDLEQGLELTYEDLKHVVPVGHYFILDRRLELTYEDLKLRGRRYKSFSGGLELTYEDLKHGENWFYEMYERVWSLPTRI